MYLVDTNVLSDARRRGSPASRWISGVPPREIGMSVISLGEMQKGFELKASHDPEGARPYLDWLAVIRQRYADRVLDVSDEVALAWGRLEARRPRGVDGLIAATAVVHGLTLVTRNVRDFADTPVPLLNPWDHTTS